LYLSKCTVEQQLKSLKYFFLALDTNEYPLHAEIHTKAKMHEVTTIA
jgi:hypothetical protein